MRGSRPDSSHREEQHGEAEQVEPAAGSGVVSNGGDSSAWCGGRVRERLGLGFPPGEEAESKGEREGGGCGCSTYPSWGGQGVDAGEEATAAMAPVASLAPQ